MSSSDSIFPTADMMVKRYYELRDEQDALDERTRPLEERLAKVNLQAEAKQLEAREIAAEIDGILGGEQLIARKKEMGQIATFLRKIPPRPVK